MIQILLAVVMAFTPQGHRIELMGPVANVEPELAWAAARTGYAQGGARIAQKPGGWYRLAMEVGELPVLWPAGQKVVAVLPDSSRVVCEELFATTPGWEERPVDLGRAAVMLEPGGLRRVKGRRKELELLVRFPGLRSDPAAIEVRRR